MIYCHWDPHTKAGEHGQSRISTEESRHRLELVGELRKIRAKATMMYWTVHSLYPLNGSPIELPPQFNQTGAAMRGHQTSTGSHSSIYYCLQRNGGFFSDPHLYIHWNQLSLDQVIILANSIIWVFLDQDSGICSTIDGGIILM